MGATEFRAALALFGSCLEKNPGYDSRFVVSSAAVEGRDSTTCLFGLIHPLVLGGEPPSDVSKGFQLTHGRLLLSRRTVSHDLIFSQLAHSEGGGPFDLGQCAVEIRADGIRVVDAERMKYLGLPWRTKGIEVEPNSSRGDHFPTEPIIHRDSELYLDAREAFTEELGLWAPSSNSVFSARLLIALPELRGRVEEISVDQGLVSFRVINRTAENLTLKVRHVGSTKHEILRASFDVSTGTEVVSVKVPHSTLNVSYALLADLDDVVDYLSDLSDLRHRSYPELTDRASQLSDLGLECRQRIHAGESEVTEFKSDVSLEGGKINEIVETAVAFANGPGGDILIGVTDRAELKSLDAPLRRQFKKNIDESFKAYIDSLRRILNKSTMPAVPFDISVVDISPGKIVRIRVFRGDAPPYQAVNDFSVYVRRGATTRRATFEEAKALGDAAQGRARLDYIETKRRDV